MIKKILGRLIRKHGIKKVLIMIGDAAVKYSKSKEDDKSEDKAKKEDKKKEAVAKAKKQKEKG